MKTKDFSVPRRMSKSAFVVLYFNRLQNLVSIFFVVAILNIFDSEKQQSFLEILGILFLIFLGCLLIGALEAFIDYYFKRYYVKDGNLIFMHGFIHRETTSIPVFKIHSMRTKRGLLYRMLDMKGVSFDTLASKTVEIELILDDADWDTLLSQVESQEGDSMATSRDTETQKNSGGNDNVAVTANTQETDKCRIQPEQYSEDESMIGPGHDNGRVDENSYRSKQYGAAEHIQSVHYSNWNLIKGALCQNHLRGMAVLGGVFVALYGKITSVSDKAIEYAFNYVEKHASYFSFSLTVIIALIVALYFVVMILWVGKVFLRYYNLQVRMDVKHLFFESGLITRLSSQFSYDKVCTVYVKQNIIERWLGCCTLMLRQAFNTTAKDKESDVKMYGSNSANLMLDWWLGKDYSSSRQIITAHSGYGVLGYTMKMDVLIVLTTCISLIYFEQYPWLILPVIYILISLCKGLFAVYRSYITLKDDYFEINTGKFADILNYVKYSNIEVVRLIRTPFTPYFHRVNLAISTNGTSFVIRSLKEQEAKDIYELLVCLCRGEE